MWLRLGAQGCEATLGIGSPTISTLKGLHQHHTGLVPRGQHSQGDNNPNDRCHHDNHHLPPLVDPPDPGCGNPLNVA